MTETALGAPVGAATPAPAPTPTPRSARSGSAPPLPSRFAALDGLRALAMLLVFAYHAGMADPVLLIARWPLLPGVTVAFARLLPHLNAGVEVFFALSGFLIYRPFVAAHWAGEAMPRAGDYLLRRFLRIYPAYLVTLLVLWKTHELDVIGFGLRDVWAVLRHASLLQLYWRDPGGIGISQAWTLTVEVSFYAFVPVWALVVRAVGRAAGPRRVEVVGAVVLTATGHLLRWRLVEHGGARLWTTLGPALAALGLGMLLAVTSVAAAHDDRLRLVTERLTRWPILWYLAAAGVYALLMQKAAANPFFPSPRVARFAIWHDLLSPLFAVLLLTPLVLGTERPSRVRAVMASRPLVFLGTVSYGAYLWHFWLIHRLLDYDALASVRSIPTHLLAIAGVFLPTLVLATLSWYLVERPALRLAHRTVRARRRARTRTGRDG